MIIRLDSKEIPFERKVQSYCLLKYPDHPKGCPNYGKRKDCPPNLPLIDEVLNFSKEIYLIYTEFDIAQHAERMKKIHPDWSDRQIYCCLYWQPKAKKMQREEEEKYKKELRLNKIITSPEAHGVDINGLMAELNLKLDWPPRKLVRIVSLGGYEK